MLLAIARNWWVLLLRGICAVLFGILAFVWPGLTLAALILLFGIYALLDGITAIALAFGRHEGRTWWEMLAVGLLSLAAGVVTFVWPALTAVVLLAIIAAWAIIRGIVEIAAAIRLRSVLEHEWLLALAGALSIAFGVILLLRPAIGALAVIWIIGAYALAFGVVALVLSMRLHHLKHELESPGGHGPTVSLA